MGESVDKVGSVVSGAGEGGVVVGKSVKGELVSSGAKGVSKREKRVESKREGVVSVPVVESKSVGVEESVSEYGRVWNRARWSVNVRLRGGDVYLSSYGCTGRVRRSDVLVLPRGAEFVLEG